MLFRSGEGEEGKGGEGGERFEKTSLAEGRGVVRVEMTVDRVKREERGLGGGEGGGGSYEGVGPVALG